MYHQNSTLSQQALFKHPQGLALLATLVIGSNGIFLTVAWLLPALSQYNLLDDCISELEIGRYGFI